MKLESIKKQIENNIISPIKYKGMKFKGEFEQINKLMIEKNIVGLKTYVEKIFNTFARVDTFGARRLRS